MIVSPWLLLYNNQVVIFWLIGCLIDLGCQRVNAGVARYIHVWTVRLPCGLEPVWDRIIIMLVVDIINNTVLRYHRSSPKVNAVHAYRHLTRIHRRISTKRGLYNASLLFSCENSAGNTAVRMWAVWQVCIMVFIQNRTTAHVHCVPMNSGSL